MYRHEKDECIKEEGSFSPRLVVVYTPHSFSVVAHQVFCFILKARLSRGRIGICFSAS